MLTKLSIETRSRTKLLPIGPAFVEQRCVHLKHIPIEQSHVGHLKTRTAHIVRKLAEIDGIILQYEVCRREQEQLLSVVGPKRSGKSVLELSMVIYGPIDYADSVGLFLVKCELYLQDPQRCELEVLYRNPQSFWAKDGDRDREIRDTAPVSETEFFKARADLLSEFEYDGELVPADQPSALKTELHQ